MPIPKTRGSKRWQWRMECLAHSLVERFAGMLPAAWAYRLGEVLGSMGWRLMPARRKVVLRNLRIAFAGSLDAGALTELSKETFRRTGGNLIAVAHTARLSRRRLMEVVHVRGIEHVVTALAKGRGAVVLVPHMGNWEVLSRLSLILPEGTRTGAFYRPLNNPLMDDRVLRRREADGTRMFSKHDGALQAVGFLRENGLLGILADQRVGPQGELVSYFGRLTRFSPLPSLLARRAKSQMLALSMVTTAPGRWEVSFLPVEPPPTTANCALALEQAIKASPADAFWLQERWKIYIRASRSFRLWLGDPMALGTTPHRALLWLADAPPSWRPPEDWFHPDLIYEVAQTSEIPPSWLPETTRVHLVTANAGEADFQRHLAEIDAFDPLPLDFILAPKSLPAVAGAALRKGLPLVPLD